MNFTYTNEILSRVLSSDLSIDSMYVFYGSDDTPFTLPNSSDTTDSLVESFSTTSTGVAKLRYVSVQPEVDGSALCFSAVTRNAEAVSDYALTAGVYIKAISLVVTTNSGDNCLNFCTITPKLVGAGTDLVLEHVYSFYDEEID